MSRLKFANVLDPDEEKDYSASWAPAMTLYADTIADADFILSAEALAAGFVIYNISFTTTKSKFWIKNTNPLATFAGDISILCKVTSTGGRKLESTAFLRVAEK